MVTESNKRGHTTLGEDRINNVKKNLNWINDNKNLFEEFKQEKIIDEYDNDTTIDLDGSIYSQGLFTKDEFSTSRSFHSISNNEKLDFLKKLEFSRIKNLGLRLIFRNYPEVLDSELKNNIISYLFKTKFI